MSGVTRRVLKVVVPLRDVIGFCLSEFGDKSEHVVDGIVPSRCVFDFCTGDLFQLVVFGVLKDFEHVVGLFLARSQRDND